MQTLQAVEAAARTGSMTRAAAELCVTHGAVSRHVRELEAQLGFELFHRDRRQLTVTPRGSTPSCGSHTSRLPPNRGRGSR